MRKTAYEMRLIDCSSDVCSSYLPSRPPVRRTDQRWARGRASRPLQARQRLCRTQSEEGVSRHGTSQALSFRPVRYRSDSALPGCSGRPGLLHQDCLSSGTHLYDRKSVVEGKRVTVRVDPGGVRIITQQKTQDKIAPKTQEYT